MQAAEQKNPLGLVFTLLTTIIIGKITLLTAIIGKTSVQLQLSLFLCYHREEIWVRDGKRKMNLGTVTFHLPRISKYIMKALEP